MVYRQAIPIPATGHMLNTLEQRSNPHGFTSRVCWRNSEPRSPSKGSKNGIPKSHRILLYDSINRGRTTVKQVIEPCHVYLSPVGRNYTYLITPRLGSARRSVNP